MKIIISEEVSTGSEAIRLLEEIAEQISNGNTCGFYPHWHLEADMEERHNIREEMNEWLPE